MLNYADARLNIKIIILRHSQQGIAWYIILVPEAPKLIFALNSGAIACPPMNPGGELVSSQQPP
jgi:hypothetical protein